MSALHTHDLWVTIKCYEKAGTGYSSPFFSGYIKARDSVLAFLCPERPEPQRDERRCPMCGGFWNVGMHGRCQ